MFKQAAFFVIGVTIVVGMLVFYNSNKVFIHNELVALDLLPKPETFTELYFNDSEKLPTSATRDHVISFAFVIHNREATNYQYAYTVAVNADGVRHIVDSGNVLVRNNQYYVKNEKIKLMNSSGRQEVVVELTTKRQSIDFWIGK